MAEAVYVLCALTSLGCAILLGRAWHRARSALLLWSLLCFVMLTINNILLYIDLAVLGDTMDLSFLRSITAFVAGALLVFGLIWDSE